MHHGYSYIFASQNLAKEDDHKLNVNGFEKATDRFIYISCKRMMVAIHFSQLKTRILSVVRKV